MEYDVKEAVRLDDCGTLFGIGRIITFADGRVFRHAVGFREHAEEANARAELDSWQQSVVARELP